jgi:hypothetical protein
VVPDARGVVLRGKNYARSTLTGNADGDTAIGTSQADLFDSHNHGGGSHTHDLDGITALGGSGNINFLRPGETAGTNNTTYVTDGPNGGTVVDTQGGNETRMRNITVNTFVKVD